MTRGALLAGRPIVVAVDSAPHDASVVRVAARLAEAHGARPHLVHALGLVPVRHAIDPLALRHQAAEIVGAELDWHVRVEAGPTASVVARRARELDAALVVMGMHHHHAVHHALHDERTLHVMRIAPCPVLAVTPSLTSLPQRALVGVDFGIASARVARTALQLLAPGGTLALAYVDSPLDDGDDDAPEADGVMYAIGVDAAFDRLIVDLAPPPGVRVEPLRLGSHHDGAVSEVLRGAAERMHADLVAVGSRRHDWLDRMLLGSVTRELAHDGRRALLVAPPLPAVDGDQRLDR